MGRRFHLVETESAASEFREWRGRTMNIILYKTNCYNLSHGCEMG